MADGNWVGDQTKPQLGGVSHLGVREPQRSKVHHFTQPFPPRLHRILPRPLGLYSSGFEG